MLICIEGVDGSGKTTLAKALADKMDARYVKMPYYDDDSVTAPIIKDILSGKRDIDIDLRRKLFGLNRYESFINDWCHGIFPDDIILDRYTLSEMVYQTNLLPSDIQEIYNFEFGLQGLHLPLPDVTIMLTGDNKVFEERRIKRNGPTDIYERNPIYLGAVNRRYKDIGMVPIIRTDEYSEHRTTISEAFNIFYVNAEKDTDEVLKEVENFI